MTRKRKHYPDCPKCKSEEVIPIIYGYPTRELVKKAEAGLYELGGCCLEGNDPKWSCQKCGTQWR